jgi:hypothetical protein
MAIRAGFSIQRSAIPSKLDTAHPRYAVLRVPFSFHVLTSRPVSRVRYPLWRQLLVMPDLESAAQINKLLDLAAHGVPCVDDHNSAEA